jgi:hypothetical protein
MTFWLVRLNERPRPVVPDSCAFQSTVRALPFAVTTAVACQLAIVAWLIWKFCDEKSRVTWPPAFCQVTSMVPVSPTRPSGPVQPLKT